MKKKLIASSLGVLAMSGSGLATYLIVARNGSQDINSITSINTSDTSSTSTSSIFDPDGGSIITNPIDIRAEVAEERDPNKWYANSAPSITDGTDWDYTQNAKAAYDYATEFGWTPEEWSYYMNYMVEFNYPLTNNFGVRDYWERANWQQPTFASDSSSFPSQAKDAAINPTFAGSLDAYDENDLANSGNPTNIDENDLEWYLYPHNGATTWFMFDENNLENAWKRLAGGENDPENDHVELGMGIFEPAGNINNIKAFKGLDASENEITRPDYFFVNGELVKGSELNSRYEYYYVNHLVIVNTIKVTDDLGWPVLITKPSIVSDDDDSVWTYEKLFDTVINPTDPSNAVDFSGTPSGYVDVSDELTATTVDYNDYLTAAANYDPAFMPLALREPGGKTDDVFESDTPFWNGYYRITYKKDNFYDHLNDFRYYHHQQSGYDGRNNGRIQQIGEWSMFPGQRFMPDSYDIGGYGYIWVEDGNGGHKIWKRSNHLPFYADSSKNINSPEGRWFPNQSYWTTDRFWGNWHYSFQSPLNFLYATEHYTDRKLS